MLSKMSLDQFVVFAILLSVNLMMLGVGILYLVRRVRHAKARLTKSLRKRKFRLIVNKDKRP